MSIRLPEFAVGVAEAAVQQLSWVQSGYLSGLTCQHHAGVCQVMHTVRLCGVKELSHSLPHLYASICKETTLVVFTVLE